MSSDSTNRPSGLLRGDLHSIVSEGTARTYRIVVDDIGGRFARITEQAWQSLCRGEDNVQLWDDATRAGWTRDRLKSPPQRFHPFAIRIPIGSIDALASRLVGASGIVFSALAVACWLPVILFASICVAAHFDEFAASLGSLQQFLSQTNPALIGFLFVLTKALHELGHAVMCRRMGARCGEIGILLLCGFPCPYVDVTDVWKQSSALRRAAVMLAGIYVELVVAAIAVFVWMFAYDPFTRLIAIDLVVICGISTIVFNANPLMRYDGYYVLSDLLTSANLHGEAHDAFRQCVTKRVAGPRYATMTSDGPRAWFLSMFHVMSTVYRGFILIAIAMLCIGLAESLHIRSIALLICCFVALIAFRRLALRSLGAVRGKGRWQRVEPVRRVAIACFLMVGLLAVLFVPVPRYRQVTGRIDVPTAANVFLPSDGTVQEVTADFGQAVSTGTILVTLDDPELIVQQTLLEGKLKVASLRRGQSRRQSLDRRQTGTHWKSLQATENAISDQLVSVRRRVSRLDVRAAVDGIIVPAKCLTRVDDRHTHKLADRRGRSVTAREPWCRITSDRQLHAVFKIDARDRRRIGNQSRVNLTAPCLTSAVVGTVVQSVSAMEEDARSLTRDASYLVLCPVPNVAEARIVSMIGQECRGVFRLPPRSVADDLVALVQSWVGQEL